MKADKRRKRYKNEFIHFWISSWNLFFSFFNINLALNIVEHFQTFLQNFGCNIYVGKSKKDSSNSSSRVSKGCKPVQTCANLCKPVRFLWFCIFCLGISNFFTAKNWDRGVGISRRSTGQVFLYKNTIFIITSAFSSFILFQAFFLLYTFIMRHIKNPSEYAKRLVAKSHPCSTRLKMR